MKAIGDTDIKTTMIYVSLGKSYIGEKVEKLNGISVPPPPVKKKASSPNDANLVDINPLRVALSDENRRNV